MGSCKHPHQIDCPYRFSTLPLKISPHLAQSTHGEKLDASTSGSVPVRAHIAEGTMASHPVYGQDISSFDLPSTRR